MTTSGGVMSAPRPPQAVHGRTRCPGCGKRFTGAPDRPTTTIPGREPRGARPGYRAGHAGQYAEVDYRWHVDCLSEHQEQNAAYRRTVLMEQRAEIEQFARDAGLDVEATLATFDAQNGTGR